MTRNKLDFCHHRISSQETFWERLGWMGLIRNGMQQFSRPFSKLDEHYLWLFFTIQSTISETEIIYLTQYEYLSEMNIWKSFQFNIQRIIMEIVLFTPFYLTNFLFVKTEFCSLRFTWFPDVLEFWNFAQLCVPADSSFSEISYFITFN